MLEAEIRDQLKSVFSGLNQKVSLVVETGDSAPQIELREMLNDVASTSSMIEVRMAISKSDNPSFWIEVNGVRKGIAFRGIPGGHEFTSLILAILNSNGLGKMPDSGLADRIRVLKGPIRIKTYVSLSCENCPEVVQALNQMALVHPDFQHEMVDGAYVPQEIERLGIQGVPSVVIDGKMTHSGRIHFLDLLAKLEDHFGSTGVSSSTTPRNLGHFDVVVVGGGPAGVSAAIYSVRKGLKTALLAEKMGGQVQETKGIENLISVPYTEGPQLAEALYKHLQAYPVEVFDRRRVKSVSASKQVDLEGGESLTAKSLIFATGAKWRELGVPGEKEYMGRGVAYCPHCDGPFYKGKRIIVVGGGNSGVEAAIDLAGIAGEVRVLEFNDQLKADQILVDKLKSLPNTSVTTNAKTLELVGDGKKIVAVKYQDRKSEKVEEIGVDGVFIQIGLLPNSAALKSVVEMTPFGEIIIDSKCRTSVPGIYAAGDVTTVPFKQIVIAMGEGAKAALAAFEDQMYGKSH